MFYTECMTCDSVNNFNTFLFESESILEYLRGVFLEYDNRSLDKDYDERANLMLDFTVLNLMCGSCHNINDYELRIVEEEIIDLLLNIKGILNNSSLDKDYRISLKNYIVSIIGGNHPIWSKYIYDINLESA